MCFSGRGYFCGYKRQRCAILPAVQNQLNKMHQMNIRNYNVHVNARCIKRRQNPTKNNILGPTNKKQHLSRPIYTIFINSKF